MNIKSMLAAGKFQEANRIIEDLSQENFEENEYFDFKRDERKLIKTYQVLSQYLMFSINHLQKKNNIINDLSQQQMKYNEVAEGIINKQKKKIKELEQLNNDYTNNCMSMEFLIKHLKLDHIIKKLGIKDSLTQDKDYIDSPINEKEYDNIKEEVQNNINNETVRDDQNLVYSQEQSKIDEI